VDHTHPVFQAQHATLAHQLQQQGISYVIKPAGGLLPQVLERGRIQKLLFGWLLEKRRFQKAGAIAVVTPREEESVRSFVPHYSGIVRWMPNPVDAQSLNQQEWWNVDIDPLAPKRVVYLGRFDVLHKGIDRLVAIARHLPDIEFHLYGTEDAKTKAWLDHIRHDQPRNVFFHPPVYGADKFRIVAEASLYIQPARWEVFGISIAEAMYLGTPCAIADSIHFAELFQQNNLGVVFPGEDPKTAANDLEAVLAEPEQLSHWSANAQAFAHEHFEPERVAQNYLQLYRDVLPNPQATRHSNPDIPYNRRGIAQQECPHYRVH
jgi:glycosyltransferase involved in cell wall biosynthesis